MAPKCGSGAGACRMNLIFGLERTRMEVEVMGSKEEKHAALGTPPFRLSLFLIETDTSGSERAGPQQWGASYSVKSDTKFATP